MRYLYHLTDTNTAKRILQEGLKPLIGERSRIVEEEEARIYLSDKKSIPYWKILLEKNVLLRIDAEKLNPENLITTPTRNTKSGHIRNRSNRNGSMCPGQTQKYHPNSIRNFACPFSTVFPRYVSSLPVMFRITMTLSWIGENMLRTAKKAV